MPVAVDAESYYTSFHLLHLLILQISLQPLRHSLFTFEARISELLTSLKDIHLPPLRMVTTVRTQVLERKLRAPHWSDSPRYSMRDQK
ncbi:hypothetical protein C8R43DRAFT_1244175 [Mycena crocata]|nr:hypothetical protein C8R43DRAFT_1244175 [Mycena crocata]